MNPSFRQDPDHVCRVPAFEGFEWIEHGFGTRRAEDWPAGPRLAMLRQVHSASVVLAADQAGLIGEGDALIANQPGQMVGVRTADCVPVLLVDSRKRAVAAIHAGWKGAAQRIVPRSISEMSIRFGTSPSDLFAAIGPAIGPCCYEVGPEVGRQFETWWPEMKAVTGPVRLDLPETNRVQLLRAGLLPERIFAGAPCTLCSPNSFHSYRRDGQRAGRMISAIGIRE